MAKDIDGKEIESGMWVKILEHGPYQHKSVIVDKCYESHIVVNIVRDRETTSTPKLIKSKEVKVVQQPPDLSSSVYPKDTGYQGD